MAPSSHSPQRPLPESKRHAGQGHTWDASALPALTAPAADAPAGAAPLPLPERLDPALLPAPLLKPLRPPSMAPALRLRDMPEPPDRDAEGPLEAPAAPVRALPMGVLLLTVPPALAVSLDRRKGERGRMRPPGPDPGLPVAPAVPAPAAALVPAAVPLDRYMASGADTGRRPEDPGGPAAGSRADNGLPPPDNAPPAPPAAEAPTAPPPSPEPATPGGGVGDSRLGTELTLSTGWMASKGLAASALMLALAPLSRT